jgi:hypothetical protein
MTETLTGRTTRTVTFIDKGEARRFGHVTGGVRRPAGTLVYVTAKRDGTFCIRVPQTLLEQDVYLRDIEPV